MTHLRNLESAEAILFLGFAFFHVIFVAMFGLTNLHLLGIIWIIFPRLLKQTLGFQSWKTSCRAGHLGRGAFRKGLGEETTG